MFGGLAVENGAPANGAANVRSRLAVLAVLAAAGDHGVRREKLWALFWPDSDDERARNALRQALFAMRRDLGEAGLTLGTTDLRLNPQVITSDISEFEAAFHEGRLTDAVALYRGPFLDGVYLKESPEFERWVEEQRARLSAEYGRALERLAVAASQQDDVASSTEWWSRAAAHDRFSSRIARAYMGALLASGDREAAIRHSEHYASVVRVELEAEPDADLLAFARRLRDSTGGNGGVVPGVAAGGETPPWAIADAMLERAAAPLRSPARTRRIRTPVLMIVALASLAGIVGLLRSKSPGSAVKSVAVGTIRNQTGDSAFDALSATAAVRITEHLLASGNVAVVDRASLTGSKAEMLIRGDISRRGDSLVGQIQIVNTRDGRVIRLLEPVEAPVAEPRAILEELQQTVSGTIAALTDSLYLPWSTAQSRPPRYSAIQEFLQGIDALVHQGGEPAVRHLRKAIELDPDFVEAKIWFLEQADLLGLEQRLIDSVSAAALTQRGQLGPFDQLALDREIAFLEGRLEDTYTASRRLVTLAPRTPDAQMYLAQAAMATRRYGVAIEALHAMDLTRGWTRDLRQLLQWDLQAHRLNGDLTAGIAEWRDAGRRAPDDYGVCSSGVLLLSTDGREASVDSLITACGKFPTAPPVMDRVYELAGRGYRSGGHLKESRRAFERALALRSLAARTDPPRRTGVGILRCELADWRPAYEILRTAADTANVGQRVALAIAAAHVGDSARAEETIRWIDRKRLNDTRRGLGKMERAFIELALGRRDQAIALLREAIAEGKAPAWNAWYVRWELAELRGDIRFEELIRPRYSR